MSEITRSIKKVKSAVERAMVHKERMNLQGPNARRLSEALFKADEAIREIEEEWIQQQ